MCDKCENFILFQTVCRAASHVSEIALFAFIPENRTAICGSFCQLSYGNNQNGEQISF